MSRECTISQDEIVPMMNYMKSKLTSTIMDSQKKKKVKTLVRWKGYGPEVDAWLKPEKFTDPDFIMEYWNRLGKQDFQSQAHADNTSSKRKAQSNHTATRCSKRLRQ